MNAETIRLDHLSIGYEGTKHRNSRIVLNDLCAAIRSGELTCLLGVNGAGKSTLLRTLAAFQPRLEGKVLIQGKELKEYTTKQLSQTIGVVLTERCDVRNLSVYELVALGRAPYTGFWGLLSQEDKNIVEKAIDRVGIRPLAARMVHTLSDGERQKAMIAKSLAQDTPVILLDEPTAFLDYPSKVEIMQLLHRLSHTMNKTIFLSTHDVELAMQLADRLWLMAPQHPLCTGVPEDLILDGTLARYFLRNEEMAFDADTVTFRAKCPCQQAIRLKGKGIEYTLVQRALMRNGIRAERDITASYNIEIIKTDPASSYYLIHAPHCPPVAAQSIEELIENVKTSIKNQMA